MAKKKPSKKMKRRQALLKALGGVELGGGVGLIATGHPEGAILFIPAAQTFLTDKQKEKIKKRLRKLA